MIEHDCLPVSLKPISDLCHVPSTQACSRVNAQGEMMGVLTVVGNERSGGESKMTEGGGALKDLGPSVRVSARIRGPADSKSSTATLVRSPVVQEYSIGFWIKISETTNSSSKKIENRIFNIQ